MLKNLGQHPKFKQVKFRIKTKIFLLDSTTISLCLSILIEQSIEQPGCIHFLILMGISAYVKITYGKTADNKGAYEIPLLKDSVNVADRFYNDFPLLNIWDSKAVFFVVRLKENLQYVIIKENELPENRHQHISKDEIIELKSEISKTKYSKK